MSSCHRSNILGPAEAGTVHQICQEVLRLSPGLLARPLHLGAGPAPHTYVGTAPSRTGWGLRSHRGAGARRGRTEHGGQREARWRAAGAARRGPRWLLGKSFNYLEAARWKNLIREGAEYLSFVNFETDLTRFGI